MTGAVEILPPADVQDTLRALAADGVDARVVHLDPWYNRGTGGVRDDYREWVGEVLALAADVGEHVFLWGFPEIVAAFVERLPARLELVAWLTWFYKNNPSVIRGWRSSQMACLHLARPDHALHPEHFLNEAQERLRAEGRLRYMPGPTSVIEAALLVGFVGRAEQTGHPAQKPEAVIEPLLQMTTVPGDLVIDPMCGSGTVGAVAGRLGRRALLCDHDEDYTRMAEERLGVARGVRRAA